MNTFAQQLKKGIPCVTNIVVALYVFISSNQRNAPL